MAMAFSLPLGAVGAPKGLTPPPVGDDIVVQVMRGGAVNIPLRAHERRGNPLAYEIDRNPRWGELEDFRQADRNRQGPAAVVYRHGNDEESMTDEFTFRARGLVGGGVSSPIKVKVQIVDAPPRLGIAPAVNFSAVAGESDAREIVLANEGGGRLEGRLSPKPPFEIDGDGRFSLGRGQNKALVVRFSPSSTDPVVPQKLSPSSADPGATVILRGEATAPFAAGAGPMVVRPDGSRTATISTTNLSSSSLRLDATLEPVGAANMPASVKIGRDTAAEIPLSIGPEKKSGTPELKVRLTSEHHTQHISIQAPPVPPKLELRTSEVDFRAGAKPELVVENTGGMEGRLTLELPRGIAANERAASFAVPPGATLSVLLRDERKIGAEAPDALVVHLGPNDKEFVPLLFPGPTPTPSPTAVSIEPSVARKTPPPMPWRLGEDVQCAESEDGIRISWRAAKASWTNAQLAKVTAGIPEPYAPAPPPRGVWQRLIEWCFGRPTETARAVQQKMNNRFTIEGQDLPAEDAEAQREAEWSESSISAEDAANESLRWCIVASHSEGAVEPVSDEFLLVGGQLRAAGIAEASTAPQPNARASAPGGLRPQRSSVIRAQPIVPTEWQPARDGAEIKFETPFNETVREYRFERMLRFFGPDPATGHPRITYEGEAFPDGSAEVTERTRATRDGTEYDVVTVRFSELLPGTEVYWRAVPLADDGVAQPPTEMLHFQTLPPWRFPWTSAALAACTIALAAVVFLRWKSRRPIR